MTARAEPISPTGQHVIEALIAQFDRAEFRRALNSHVVNLTIFPAATAHGAAMRERMAQFLIAELNVCDLERGEVPSQ